MAKWHGWKRQERPRKTAPQTICSNARVPRQGGVQGGRRDAAPISIRTHHTRAPTATNTRPHRLACCLHLKLQLCSRLTLSLALLLGGLCRHRVGWEGYWVKEGGRKRGREDGAAAPRLPLAATSQNRRHTAAVHCLLARGVGLQQVPQNRTPPPPTSSQKHTPNDGRNTAYPRGGPPAGARRAEQGRWSQTPPPGTCSQPARGWPRTRPPAPPPKESNGITD